MRTLDLDWERIKLELERSEDPSELPRRLPPREAAVALPYTGCRNPSELLRRDPNVGTDPLVTALLTIHTKVAAKVEEWAPLACPDVRAAEELTGEHVARAKARFLSDRAGGRECLDLCAGIGGDTLALSRHYHVTSVELEDARVRALRTNARLHALKDVQVVKDDATRTPPDADAAHADPSRRGARRPEGTSPPATELRELLDGLPHLIEVPPATPARPGTAVFSRAREVRAVCWTNLIDGTAAIVSETRAVLEGDPETPRRSPRPDRVAYIIEQDPAVRKARLSTLLAEELDAYPTLTPGRESLLATTGSPPEDPPDHVIRVVKVGEEGEGPPIVRSIGVRLGRRDVARLRKSYERHDVVYVTRAGTFPGRIVHERGF
ncbi:MAG: hypothetical protein ABGY09_06925 [Euryarchaeota archaeon]